MTVYQSGAFLQQCFAVHPLSLEIKVVTLPALVGIVCHNCRMRHRLTINLEGSTRLGNHTDRHDGSLDELYTCAQANLDELRLALVDVVKGRVEIRCRPCRRTISLAVERFETHQSQ